MIVLKNKCNSYQTQKWNHFSTLQYTQKTYVIHHKFIKPWITEKHCVTNLKKKNSWYRTIWVETEEIKKKTVKTK